MLIPRIDSSGTTASRVPGRQVVLDLVLLSLLVGVAYFARMTELPILGEEGRRARGAINMIETGDWIVLRQQGIVFPDRPPMTNWLIAAAGSLRDEIDLVAIRLPSLLAVLATTLVIYLYGSRLDSRIMALTAAAAFATFGQVLQLGRLGESEAVFTFLLAAALLLWHLAFSLGRSPTLAFTVGYSLAALAALVKGLQAPVYFIAVTGVFLIINRNWRWLLGRGQWLGLAAFLAIVGAWQVPYYLATDLDSSLATWFDVVGPRVAAGGLLPHLASFPFETLICLLPWSMLLLALTDRALRRAVAHRHAAFSFVLTCLAVTYPTVWLSAGAKGRYYMPLYPCAALLIGMIVHELAAAEAGTRAARWRRLVLGTAAGGAVLAIVATALTWLSSKPELTAVRPTAIWTLTLLTLAALSFVLARAARRNPGADSMRRSLAASAALLGVLATTLWLNGLDHSRQDLTPLVAAARNQIPIPEALVSFGPADPRFTYHYRHFIREVPWPLAIDALDPGIDYFCFDRRPTDTAQTREAWRGMRVWTTPGTLPFAWEEVARVAVGTKAGEEPPSVAVIIGRVLRDAQGAPQPAPR